MSEPHAITRARERYGIELKMHDLQAIAAEIRGGRSLLLRAETVRYETHGIVYRGEDFVVIYRDDNRDIVTILPKASFISKSRAERERAGRNERRRS